MCFILAFLGPVLRVQGHSCVSGGFRFASLAELMFGNPSIRAYDQKERDFDKRHQ